MATEALIENSQTRSLNLNQIEVKGGSSHSNAYFQSTLQPLLRTKDVTFETLTAALDESTANLKRSGQFANIAVTLDHDASVVSVVKATKPYEEPIPVKAVFSVEEMSMLLVLPSLTTHNNEAALGLAYVNTNFNGNGENVSAVGSVNPYANQKLLNVSMATPLQTIPETSSVFLVEALSEASPAMHATLVLGKMLFHTTHCAHLTSGFGLSVANRSFVNLTEKITDALRKDMGLSSQTSMFADATFNSVSHDKFFPANGLAVVLHNEINNCTDGADKKLNYQTLKTELDVDYYKSFPCHNFVTLGLHAKVGNVATLNAGDAGLVHFHDKFSASMLYGSQLSGHGLVPEPTCETVYGSATATVGSSLSFKVPYLFKLSTPIRFTMFGDVNHLGDAPTCASLKSALTGASFKALPRPSALGERFLVNYGCGLKYNLGIAGFDISYVVSNSKYSSSFKPGFQLNFTLGTFV